MAHPDWAVKFRRPGTELRRVNDSLYKLYECSSVYDKEKKRARKITGKYLGSITEAGGFKESRKRIMEREIAELKKTYFYLLKLYNPINRRNIMASERKNRSDA